MTSKSLFSTRKYSDEDSTLSIHLIAAHVPISDRLVRRTVETCLESEFLVVHCDGNLEGCLSRSSNTLHDNRLVRSLVERIPD